MKSWNKLEILKVEMSQDCVSDDLHKRFWTQLIYGLTPLSSQRLRGSTTDSIILPSLSLLQLGMQDEYYDGDGELQNCPNTASALVAFISARAVAFEGQGRLSIMEAANGFFRCAPSPNLFSGSKASLGIKLFSGQFESTLNLPLTTTQSSG